MDRGENAVPAAKAVLAGGVDVMEITFRTAAALESIAAVSSECPEMLVGAGTVLNQVQCKNAIEAGAGFIVSPGFDRKTAEYCLERKIAVTPGCVTPTEIMQALELGLKVVKFFPANVYGGLAAMKALAGPFTDVKFIPTGGVNAGNLKEYITAPFVYAVGGTWMCSKGDISDGRFDRITQLCREAKQIVSERV